MKNPETILITGASSGIGAALAARYAAAGKTLFLCGRNMKRLNAVKKACEKKGALVLAEKIDVTDAKSVKNWIKRCHKIAPVDLTLANAGVSVGNGGEIESEDEARALFAVNIDGVVNTVLPSVDLCLKRGAGQIALLSSLAGYRGLPGAVSYSASKNFVRAWGEALRGSLKKHNVEINVICPGFVKSGITAKNKFRMPFLMEADKAAAVIAKNLAKNKGRITFPKTLALAVWLLSCLPASLAEIVYNFIPSKNKPE